MQASTARLVVYCCHFLALVAIFCNATADTNQDDKKCDTEQQVCSLETTDRETRENLYSETSNNDNCFRAAVLDFNRIDLEDCKSSARANLDILEHATKVAKENGARIIVYPEDGIYIGSREYTTPCLEEVRNPEELDDKNNNPCITQSESSETNPILRRLSCIARKHNIYVVANYGTKQSCDRSTDLDLKSNSSSDCNEDGFMPLNTDVVFDPEGRYIKRYRKYNIFVEVFSKAPRLEHTYFDTPFGRFGVFTCFDIIFKSPSVELVEEFHIDTAIFPTWWYDELPMLAAVQVQDAWSWTNRVNLLASNIIRPSLGSTGSGIYSGINSIYTMPNNRSKLLLANLDIKPSYSHASKCANGFGPKSIDLSELSSNETYQYKNYDILSSDATFRFNESVGEKTLCSGQVCCSVDYEISKDKGFKEDDVSRLLLIVRDSRRQGRFKWYEQVCTLAFIKETVSKEGEPDQYVYSELAGVSFKRLSLSATFDTRYVYPISAHDISSLVHRTRRKFDCDIVNFERPEQNYCQLEFIPNEDDDEDDDQADKDSSSNMIYSFGMYARVYENDPQ